MSIKVNLKLLLDVFSAVEQRNDQRFRELVHPEFEIHWPPSLPYGGTARGLAHAAPTWSETWIPLQPTEMERRMDPRVVAGATERITTGSWSIAALWSPQTTALPIGPHPLQRVAPPLLRLTGS